MMAPRHGQNEVFIGNLPAERARSFVAACRSVCPSAREATGALDLRGAPLPEHRAIFIARSDEAAYDAWRMRGGGRP